MSLSTRNKDILFKKVMINKMPIGNKNINDAPFIVGHVGLVVDVYEDNAVEVAFFHERFKDTVSRTFDINSLTVLQHN